MKREILLIAIVAGIVGFLTLTLRPMSAYGMSKEPERVNFPFKDFTGLSLEMNAEVHLTQGTSFSVEGICAEPGILNVLDLEIKRDKLIIQCKDKGLRKEIRRIMRKRGLRFNITMPTINFIGLTSSGSIIAEEPISSQSLTVALQGSGDCRLSTLAVVSRYTMLLEGSGDLRVNSVKVGEDADVKLNGSGDLEIHTLNAQKSISVRLEGSGDLGIKNLSSSAVQIILDGSGDIAIPNALANNDAKIIEEGSGSIKLDEFKVKDQIQIKKNGSCDLIIQSLSARKLDLLQEGSGDFALKGKGSVQSLTVRNNGSGDFEGLKLESQQASVLMSGSGDVEVNTQDLTIQGGSSSGTLTVKGRPRIKSSGSARIALKTVD